MALQDHLGNMRKSARLSQQKLADMLGIERSHVSHLENKVRAASLDMMERWAQACGFDVTVLPRDAPLMNEDLVAYIRNLSFDQRMTMIRLARIMPGLPEHVRATLDAELDIWERAFGAHLPFVDTRTFKLPPTS